MRDPGETARCADIDGLILHAAVRAKATTKAWPSA